MGLSLSRERFERILIRTLRVAGIAFFIVIVAFPFYWMIVSSFKSLEEILMNPANLGVDFRKVDFGAYYEVLFEHGFLRYISNSVYVSFFTVLLSVTLATIGAYAVTRLRFRGRGFMSYSILIIYMFPAIVLVIPLYVVFSRMGLRDSITVLILVYLAQTLPVALYMLRSYFQSLPLEIEYAGLMDGCSRFGVIWRIIIPLSRGVVQLAGSVHLSKQLVMAASVMVTIPILLVFLFFERHLVRGLTAGAMKG